MKKEAPSKQLTDKEISKKYIPQKLMGGLICLIAAVVSPGIMIDFGQNYPTEAGFFNNIVPIVGRMAGGGALAITLVIAGATIMTGEEDKEKAEKMKKQENIGQKLP